jgi:succinate dehydrogenase / fumarate reductase cytochrome b subunit
LGVLVFLLAHIVDTALLGWGPDVFNRVMAVYRHPFYRLSEHVGSRVA